ncbi:MAG: hypothetical protein RDU89_08530 [bacterium]|nr:hypothetical protein [bacterium]
MGETYAKVRDFVREHGTVQVRGRMAGNLEARFSMEVDRITSGPGGATDSLTTFILSSTRAANTFGLGEEAVREVHSDGKELMLVLDDGTEVVLDPAGGEGITPLSAERDRAHPHTRDPEPRGR